MRKHAGLAASEQRQRNNTHRLLCIVCSVHETHARGTDDLQFIERVVDGLRTGAVQQQIETDHDNEAENKADHR